VGFLPSRAFPAKTSTHISAGLHSHAYQTGSSPSAEANHNRRPDASQRLDQPLPGPNLSKRQARSIGPNNPRRVPAPARS
jgi:hypothetical protein